MHIDYDEEDDILFIRFSDDPVEQDISCGWNVTGRLIVSVPLSPGYPFFLIGETIPKIHNFGRPSWTQMESKDQG